MAEILKLMVVQTPDKIFVSEKADRWSRKNIGELFFDGKHPGRSFNQDWFVVKKLPTIIEKEVSQPNINGRYELKDSSLCTDKIPLLIKEEEVKKDADYNWVGKYAGLRSLYDYKSDPQPPVREPVEFVVEDNIEVKATIEFYGLSYPVQRGQYRQDGFIDLTQENVSYDLLDTLQLPDLLLPLRPAHLTSEQTYKIVRKHVQDNIDPKFAVITSDYDFCFTVKKKIPIERVEYKVDVNNSIFSGKKRKPKIVTRYRDDRQITIFEMTYSPKNYDRYPPIEPFRGETLKDLKKNIDAYLADLMKEINAPIKDCPCCKGIGVVGFNNQIGSWS